MENFIITVSGALTGFFIGISIVNLYRKIVLYKKKKQVTDFIHGLFAEMDKKDAQIRKEASEQALKDDILEKDKQIRKDLSEQIVKEEIIEQDKQVRQDLSEKVEKENNVVYPDKPLSIRQFNKLFKVGDEIRLEYQNSSVKITKKGKGDVFRGVFNSYEHNWCKRDCWAKVNG